MTIHTPSNRRSRRVRLATDLTDLTDLTDDVARVELLARTVEAALAGERDHPPTLVAATTDGDTVELRLKPLADHPAVELEGFVAPTSWWCLGVVAEGRARPVDVAGPLDPDPPASPYPIHLAHVVTRSGATARVLRDRGADEVTVHAATGPGHPDEPGDLEAGVIDDYVRLALRLPTPPPRRDTTELYAAMWIHLAMNEAALHRLLDAPWAAVAALHPVLDITTQVGDGDLRDWAVDHLVEAGELLARSHPWARVRATCQEGIGPVGGRAAELAGWLDDGAFSRLVLSNLGPLEDLLADLHHLVRPEVHARLLDTVAAWGLLAAPPD